MALIFLENHNLEQQDNFFSDFAHEVLTWEVKFESVITLNCEV